MAASCSATPIDAPHRAGLAHHVVARHPGPPGRGLQQRGEHADGRGLAGPVGAEEAEDLALVHHEVDAVDRHHVAEVTHETFRHDRRVEAHAPRAAVDLSDIRSPYLSVTPLADGRAACE